MTFSKHSEAIAEIQNYHDDRSEQWQESDRAEDLLAKLERLQEAATQVQEID